jgi:predicted alpha/beta hydrolase
MPSNIVILVLGIVAITTFGRIYMAKHGLASHRLSKAERRDRARFVNRPTDADDPESVRMREEIKALKDRIQVLERVITDANSATALEREIEKLR